MKLNGIVKPFPGNRECGARRSSLLGFRPCPDGPVFAGGMRDKATGLRSGVARRRRVFGLTMAAEVSVHFPARPFGPCGSSRAGGKAVR